MSEHVSIQDLSVSLGGHQILNHLSLSVENPGHMIALLGPNGSGKTTLLRAICGELSHSGHVLLNGQDLTALSPKALAGLVSYIPQQSGISISMSALDVVLMGFYSRLKLFEQPSAKMREAALQALASVGMDDFANRDYLTLSGGEQQLVILARTLIEDTSLLLFDEPDSSLDLGNKYRMMGLIADIVQAAQGGRSASPAFFPYKKNLSRHILTLGPIVCNNLTLCVNAHHWHVAPMNQMGYLTQPEKFSQKKLQFSVSTIRHSHSHTVISCCS